MGDAPATRALEDGVITDLNGRLTYAGYLGLGQLLDSQHPVSGQHDEMLFIIQHQVTELWLKLLIHELRSAIALLSTDALAPTLKRLARIKHIQRQMLEQWAVLATLTPAEYAQFRDALGTSSGFQSWQYRTVEFLLGNKNAATIKVFEHNPEIHSDLERTLHSPSLYDEFLRYLARRGYAIPAEATERDWSQPYQRNDAIVRIFREIYSDTRKHWEAYEMCEKLVDVEEYFQLWRFRHLKTVERIIGFRPGTGGSSGASFLRQALDLTFFPELLTSRTEAPKE